MCADHAVRYCISAGNNPERSGTQGMEKILAKMSGENFREFGENYSSNTMYQTIAKTLLKTLTHVHQYMHIHAYTCNTSQ